MPGALAFCVARSVYMGNESSMLGCMVAEAKHDHFDPADLVGRCCLFSQGNGNVASQLGALHHLGGEFCTRL